MNETEQKEYDKLEAEMQKIGLEIDKPEFKNNISLQNETFKRYLELSDAQHKIKPHNKKRRLKDKLIKQLLDYSNIVLEMKIKSHTAYLRMQETFKNRFNGTMRKMKEK